MAIAERGYTQPGNELRAGVARAMVAVLSSPRFLFRVEERRRAQEKGPHRLGGRICAGVAAVVLPLVHDAGRRALRAGCQRGELRKNLAAQVKRMMADPRLADRSIENFTGQWLQARDVEGIAIDARAGARARQRPGKGAADGAGGVPRQARAA